jgi:hypothetical protein
VFVLPSPASLPSCFMHRQRPPPERRPTICMIMPSLAWPPGVHSPSEGRIVPGAGIDNRCRAVVVIG